MPDDTVNKFAAGKQALGYIYQSRLALLHLLQLPENIGVHIEKDDDLDFIEEGGRKSLASLKHKSVGDRLTNLSTDFWKSVRIWLERYNTDHKLESSLRFFIFTTSEVSENSFLKFFLPYTNCDDFSPIVKIADSKLVKSTSKIIIPIKTDFDLLNEDEKSDFLSRIVIFDNSPRIDEIPDVIIDKCLRTVRREFRQTVFERLEGWWNDLVIKLLTGIRSSEIYGFEISDKLSAITDEYKTDNLPINFRNSKPKGDISPEEDNRLFVMQLREIGIKPNRIQNAIYDYYRAFEQRSSWARENVLFEGEVEEYEDRLVSEWERYRDVVFEDIDDQTANDILISTGRELYKWAELNTDSLRIRERVSEPYVVRGNFHILANYRPKPRIYWHPLFLENLNNILKRSL